MKNIFIVITILFFANQASAQFYATPKGTHYHRGDCRQVERNSYEISEYRALIKDLKLCSFCNPNRRGPGGGKLGLGGDDNQGEGSSMQCSATTAKGTRCKHKTKISGGLCYQHGGG